MSKRSSFPARPPTDEVIPKVLLLTRDHTIRDPTILAQLR